MPTEGSFSPAEWSVEALKRKLDAEEPLFVFDVRNRDEYAAGRVEGRVPHPALNVPYFEILEAGGGEDMVEAVKNFGTRELAGRLPKDNPIVAVCAKGGTSAIVAEALRAIGYPAVNLAGGTRAWGEMYEILPALDRPGLQIWQAARPARGCLSYIAASGPDAVVIDPLRHVDRYLEFARRKQLKIRFVLDTHAHADHLSGGPALARAAGATYHLHPYDAIHPMDLLPAKIPYEPLRDGQVLRFGSAALEAIHIPGHTLGNMAFLLDRNTLFTGDSIFVTSIARPDLGGHAEAWTPLHRASLRRLLELPDDTFVLPAHASGPQEADRRGVVGARLGDLRVSNEGLRRAAGAEKDFQDWILASLPVFPPQYVDIKRANIGLVRPDEDAAQELELGKNVCALEARKGK